VLQAKKGRKKSAVMRARSRTTQHRGTALLSFVKAQNTPTTQKRGHSNQDSRHQEQQQSSRRHKRQNQQESRQLRQELEKQPQQAVTARSKSRRRKDRQQERSSKYGQG